MYDQHAHDLREAQAAAAIEIKGRLEDADDGELAAALALVLEKAGVDVPTAQSGSAVLDVETNWVWDNVMVGLSFEDAAACLGFACRSVKDRPQRERGRFEDVYTVYGTQPGCAAHLFASGGTP